MLIDNYDEFLREVTLRICSSLKIQTALSRTFEYLQQHFPAHECFFQRLDNQLCALRNLVYVTAADNTTSLAMPTIPLSRELWKWCFYMPGPYVVERKSSDKFVRDLAKAVGLEENQDLVMQLREENRLIGALVLRTKAQDRFEAHHLDLLGVILRPISMAMSNALAHESVVRNRDQLLDDNRFLKNELQKDSPQDVIGASEGLANIMGMVKLVAPLDNIVLLLGETGVGKEVIANAIHYSSPRSKRPFVKVNCGAIPENLIDSELFGHERGAFTGALTQKRGRFERAAGGTLFLDEIGELPPAAQVRLLRVLQHREIERVGGTEPITVDTRIIAATHQKLDEMVSENRFREDLWYRLNVFPIIIPPLRQRSMDLPELTRYFIKRKCEAIGISPQATLAPGALERLLKYRWPGNIRELENVIERELILHRAGPLTFISLSPSEGGEEHQEQSYSIKTLTQSLRLDDVIAAHIESVIRSTNGKIHGLGGAAEILGLPSSTLRAKMRKLNITVNRITKRIDRLPDLKAKDSSSNNTKANASE